MDVSETYIRMCEKAVNFGQWVGDLAGVYDWSLEQLWLAYVMKERHDKIWSGSLQDWVKE